MNSSKRENDLKYTHVFTHPYQNCHGPKMAAPSEEHTVLVGLSDDYSASKLINAISNHHNKHYYRVERLGSQNITAMTQGVVWVEYEDLPFDTLAHNMDSLLGNSYCIRKGLIRKSEMAYVIQKYISKNPSSILKTAVPETYNFELDDPYYFEEAMSEVFEVAAELRENALLDDVTLRKRWILKPSITNKGAEILVFDTEEQLRNMFESRYEQLCDDEESDEAAAEKDDDDDDGDQSPVGGNLSHIRQWVMQRYVANPLCLFGGRKFHIRTYVLAVSNIRVYVFREMLALFAGLPFDSTDLGSSCHITNTCVQIGDGSFQESDLVKRFWALSPEVDPARLDSIFQQIKDIVKEVFLSVSREVTVFQPMRNMFELYGLDFLVDESFNVYYLEANAFPDFRQTGGELSGLIESLFAQSVSVALDPFFKIPPGPSPDLHLVLDLPLRHL